MADSMEPVIHHSQRPFSSENHLVIPSRKKYRTIFSTNNNNWTLLMFNCFVPLNFCSRRYKPCALQITTLYFTKCNTIQCLCCFSKVFGASKQYSKKMLVIGMS